LYKTFVNYLLNSHKNTALDGHIRVHKVDYNETQHIRNSANAIYTETTFSLVIEVRQAMWT